MTITLEDETTKVTKVIKDEVWTEILTEILYAFQAFGYNYGHLDPYDIVNEVEWVKDSAINKTDS